MNNHYRPIIMVDISVLNPHRWTDHSYLGMIGSRRGLYRWMCEYCGAQYKMDQAGTLVLCPNMPCETLRLLASPQQQALMAYQGPLGDVLGPAVYQGRFNPEIDLRQPEVDYDD